MSKASLGLGNIVRCDVLIHLNDLQQKGKAMANGHPPQRSHRPLRQGVYHGAQPQNHGDRTWREPQQRDPSRERHHRQIRKGLNRRPAPQQYGHRARLSFREPWLG